MPNADTSPRPRACVVCDGTASVVLPRYSRDPWLIGRCLGCGFVHLMNPPGHAALDETFAWEKGLDAEVARRLDAAPVLYRLDYATRFRTGLFARPDMRNYVKWFGAGSLLDVGCGTGGRIQSPFVPFGIEVSGVPAKEADADMRARGGRCLHGPGAEMIWRFEEEQFDGIVMRSYLEHEEDALRVLQGARRALKPSGGIYVKVPNFGSLNRVVAGRHWCGLRMPDHVNYFTTASLKALARRAGLSMSLLNRVNLALDDNIHVLLRRA